MKTILVVAMFLSLNIFAQERVAIEREGGGRPGANAVFVVLKSFGTGIDSLTKTLVKELIDNGIENNTIRKATFERWGREGEITFCANFRKSQDRVSFIKEISPSIIDDRARQPFVRTDVLVGSNCKDILNATSQQIGMY